MLLRLTLHNAVLILLFVVSTSAQAGSAARNLDTLQPENARDSLQQFTSKGHVTGFKVGEMYIAAMDHSVNVKFLGANPIAPVSSQPPNTTTSPQPLQAVNYHNLWDGIDLEYDHGNGIVRSTYTLASGAAPQDIALLYNTEFKIQQNGALHLNFETGVLTESAPLAWQDINGKRLPVDVAFIETTKNQLGFEVGEYDINQPLIIDPTTAWLTFMGAADSLDSSYAITTDANNNIFIAGSSSKKWGTPLGTSLDTGGILVAKLDSSGALLWHTFVGDGSALGIALNGSGDIWITGISLDTWGTDPINDHTTVKNAADPNADFFVAKLNSSGELQWHTFHGHAPIEFGTSGFDSGPNIVVDSSGNSYVSGTSGGSWFGNPTTHFGGQSGTSSQNIVVFKLDADGVLGWNGFYGDGLSRGNSIALARDSSLFVAGYSVEDWDSETAIVPIGVALGQATVIRIGLGGFYWWHTFLGPTSSGESIAADSFGNAFITGVASLPIAGETIRPYTGARDVFVAKLNIHGIKQWHTFLGSDGDDGAATIAMSEQSIYVAGNSDLEWGTPLNPHTAGLQNDVMVAELDLNGELRHHTFLGSTSPESAQGAVIDTNNDLVITGTSLATWPETAIVEHSGGTETEAHEIFVRKVDFPVVAEIEVLGNNLVISNGDLEPAVNDDTDFGDVAEAGEFTIERSYTIRSFGTGPIILDGVPMIEISGANASDFSVTSLPSSPVPTSSSTEFSVAFNPTAVGLRTATISIDNNVSDENPYVFSVQGTGNPPLPEIEVRGGGLPSLINNGSTQARSADGTSFAPLFTGIDDSITHTFRINNLGTSDLNLSGDPSVDVSGPNTTDFIVTLQPATTISGPGTTTFDIKYELSTPATKFEARRAVVSIANNDSDEDPYTFAILGLASFSVPIGGTLTGMAPGNSIVLQNYSSRTFETIELNLSANGVFVFDPRIPENFPYEVTIKNLPDNPEQVCEVVNGEGTTFQKTEITDIEVNCVPIGYTVGGTASGLKGEGLILQINNADDLAVNANGEFTFAVGFDDAAVYDVSILNPPIKPGQNCTLSNNSGTINLANVTNVGLDCVTLDLIFGRCAGSMEEPGCSLDEP